MRINWFSPLPPAPTDIANFTVRILPALASHAEVTVWTDATHWDPLPVRGVRVRSCSELPKAWPDVNFADFSLLNIGNDVRFHGRFAELAESHSSVVVLHDINLHEMQRMRLLHQKKSWRAYLALLARHGGDEALRLGRRNLETDQELPRLLEIAPLTESVLDVAEGVVVHNAPAFEAVARFGTHPCLQLPLGHVARNTLQPAPARNWDGQRPLRIVLFGFLNSPNRRVPEFLQA